MWPQRIPMTSYLSTTSGVLMATHLTYGLSYRVRQAILISGKRIARNRQRFGTYGQLRLSNGRRYASRMVRRT